MVVEDFITFSDWIGSGLLLFGGIVLAAAILGLFCGYLVASFRHGPFEAFYVVSQVIGQAIPDFLFTSPRRVWAIARLAIKEAFRRKVILVTFGIKNKTIYTVVTKPVRPTEIVIGRILGFGLLGTGLLALMALISFLFVWRGLAHEHQIVGDTQTLASFVDIPADGFSSFTRRRASEDAVMEAETSSDAGHSHRLELINVTRDISAPQPRVQTNIIDKVVNEADGTVTYRKVTCTPVGGHTHQVFVEGQGEDAKISIGPAVGYFRARVPIYASMLQFYDRAGNATAKGVNIGKEWSYRGYVDGGTPTNRTSLSKAEFKFENFVSSNFRNADILPLEMTLGVFRTYKADIEKRVTAGLQFQSVPETELDPIFISDVIPFETNEYSIQTLPISRKIVGKLVSPDGKLLDKGEFDLFDDFAGKNQKVNGSTSSKVTSESGAR